jgi:hypothetical protein
MTTENVLLFLPLPSANKEKWGGRGKKNLNFGKRTRNGCAECFNVLKKKDNLTKRLTV